MKELFEDTGRYWSATTEKQVLEREDPSFAMTASTETPFDYDLRLTGLRRLIKTADTFGVSLDYLLCRTDYPELVKEAPKPEVSKVNTGWQTGEPDEPGTYLLMLDSGYGSRQFEKWTWDGVVWKDFVGAHDPDIDGEIKGWIPMPEEVESK